MTPSQLEALRVLAGFNLIESAATIGARMRPMLGRLAATSVLRALERRGLAHRIAPKDRWSVALWGITAKGRETLR